MSDEAALAAVRLLAVDVDGTLLTNDHRVLPEVSEAFARGRAAGLDLVIASARSPGALRHILDDLGHSGTCVCFSGAWTGTIGPAAATAHVEAETTIPRPTALAIADVARKAGLAPSWHTQRRWAVPLMSPTVEREMRTTRQTPVVSQDLSAEDAPNKILLVGPRPLLLRLRAVLNESHGETFDSAFSHDDYLEVLPKGVDKARAVLSLAAARGLGSESVAAVGDAQNDIGMIRAAGYGVAMGNAIPELRAAARWVTSSNQDGGVARLIHRILASR